MKNTLILSLTATSLLTAGLSAAEGEWNSSFDLGATITRGNSDSSLVTVGFLTSKLGDTDEYLANLSYTFGDTNGVTDTDELLAGAAWNRLLSDTFYAGLRLDFRRDEIADIDYRINLTALVGNYFIKNETTYLAIEAGIGYSWEKVGGITSGGTLGSLSDDYAHAYVGDRFEHKFNDKTRIYQILAATAPLKDFHDFSLVAEAGLETFLSDTLALKISVQDKYEEKPAVGRKRNDVRLVTGISYKF